MSEMPDEIWVAYGGTVLESPIYLCGSSYKEGRIKYTRADLAQPDAVPDAEGAEKVRELASKIATMTVKTGAGEDVDNRAENSHRKFLGEKILALLPKAGA